LSARGTGGRAASRERRRLRILAAAEELFAADGFAKTTVDEIARRAGVSKGLVYSHYDSKEELLRAVWSRQVDAWMLETHKRVKYNEGGVADAVGDVLAASVRHARDNPLLGRILSQDPGSLIPHERDDVAAFGRYYRELLEPALAHGVKSGELRRSMDVTHTAELIWLMHFTLIREIFVGAVGGWRSDGEALLGAAIELVVEGLRA
jgi:AcrR family transcriptional regulator